MSGTVAHTFLVREGRWRAEGEFIDGFGTRTGVVGEAEVRHEPERWVSASVMRTTTPRPIESKSVYEIRPLVPGNLSTPWTSHSATAGAVSGRFLFLGDAIVSTWESATGRFRGTETLLMRDPSRYSARGALYDGGKLLSAWVVELTTA